MPEGDTLYRTAVRLRGVLLGKEVLSVEARDPQLGVNRLVGRTMTQIEARGKHLLIHFRAPTATQSQDQDQHQRQDEPTPAGPAPADGLHWPAAPGSLIASHTTDPPGPDSAMFAGRSASAGPAPNQPSSSFPQPTRAEDVLHSHLGMTGSWHLYRPGEPWRKPAHRAAVVLHCRVAVAVCFSPKTLELLSADAFRRHRYLQQLGPDLLGEELDESEILRRFRIHDATPLGQAVMNQTLASGIGNVYKSEILFMLQLSPFEPVRALTDTQLLALIQTARLWMQKNLEGYPRTTRLRGDGGGRKWVYGRAGQPCFTCGTLIRMQRQGDLGRSTYWCPTCQPTATRVSQATSPLPNSPPLHHHPAARTPSTARRPRSRRFDR